MPTQLYRKDYEPHPEQRKAVEAWAVKEGYDISEIEYRIEGRFDFCVYLRGRRMFMLPPRDPRLEG